jgi:hypothetical protein
MAKKQITATSSPAEIKAANEQLAKAQQEYANALKPYRGQSLSLIQQEKIANSVASKYDYVDFGTDPSTVVPGEINIGGTGSFFVNGLNNNSKTKFQPEAKTTVNTDDAFPVTNTTRPAPTINSNPKTNNPSQSKLDQNIVNETSPVTATQSTQVNPETTQQTTGSKDVTQAGAALESNSKVQNTQTGIVNQKPNDLPTTNNLPGRLSDEFSKENPTLVTNNRVNSDDAATAKSMGTAITGFGNVEGINGFPDPSRTNSTGLVTAGSNNSILVSPTSGGTPNNPSVPIRSNILHNYANWTYKIGFYALKISDYNSIIEGGDIPPSARTYPIAVSGGYQRNGENGTNFERDIYIDSLRFTSVIGNRLEGKATNNIDIELQLIEPYSANFLGELAQLAMRINEEKTTLGETPYLLEIDFTGYTDAGEVVPSILKDGKKYIPVKIISADMKIDSAGARYTFGLVPYSFYMFTQKKTDLPKDVWVYGEKVNEILGDGEFGLIGRLNNIEKEKVQKDRIQEFEDKYKIKFYSFDKKGSKTEELQNSVVAFPTENGPATIIKNRKIDENSVLKQGYTVKAGSLIKDVIKDLVLTSEYFNLKMNPNGVQNKDNKNPAELIKVIPQVTLTTNWDKKRNEYAKEITYHVFNTLLFGEVFSHGGQALIGDWGYSKVYNYIFTGQNTDILNLDINFNMLYYTTFFTDKNELGTILTDIAANRNAISGDATPTGFSDTAAKSGNIAKTAPNEPSRYINASLAAEFMNLKMNNSNADMISVDMSIIGDPDWIPQDSSIRGGEISVANFETKLDAWNSIAVDVAGVYAKLQLRTPMDYNDSNGMMNLSGDKSMVGGVYQIITVENMFQGGKYTCNLNMVKIPNQEENKKPKLGTERF